MFVLVGHGSARSKGNACGSKGNVSGSRAGCLRE